MWRAALPPCCDGCEAFRRTDGQCALLAHPSPENRSRLLTMPCDVQRLLERRFRRQGEDVARDAIVKWLDPAWAPDDIVRSFGRAPRDARIWLTSWPYLYLGRTSVRRQQREHVELIGLEEEREPGPPRDPTLPIRVTDALDQVRRIDVVSYSMLLDILRDGFDPRAWQELLGLSEASITDRKYMAVYRYAVCFHAIFEALASVPEEPAVVALKARRFAAGEPSDQAALEACRTALQNPGLTMSAWRALYRDGAVRSLDLLGGPEALGAQAMTQLGTAFRRVLKLD